MKLLYELHKSQKPDFLNFGDELNLWIWPTLIPELLDGDGSVVFAGIGTVLDDTLPTQPVKVIFGAGNGYRPIPPIDDKFRFYCVRGPLTAEALSLPSKFAITDPAVLVNKLLPPRSVEKGGIALMGHYTSALHGDWSFACEELGYSYIHPFWPKERIFDCILSAKFVVAEAMHGAIVADALRVPWVPVITSASECSFKWHDWTKSVGLEYDPIRLPALWDLTAPPKSPVSRLRRSVKRRKFLNSLAPSKLSSRVQLSSDSVIDTCTSRLLEEVEKLKKDAVREGWGRHKYV